MKKSATPPKKYSKIDLEKIRKRAREIWQRKCQAMNTALDDWLQAEQELKASAGLQNKSSDQYTGDEVAKIRARAQAIRESKVQSLRTAFDDWIEAEQELKGDLKKKIKLHDLFDLWFNRSASHMSEILGKDSEMQAAAFHDVLEHQYVELMAESMH